MAVNNAIVSFIDLFRHNSARTLLPCSALKMGNLSHCTLGNCKTFSISLAEDFRQRLLQNSTSIGHWSVVIVEFNFTITLAALPFRNSVNMAPKVNASSMKMPARMSIRSSKCIRRECVTSTIKGTSSSSSPSTSNMLVTQVC